jgi:ubiquitin carboxyl-terminal hydrolase 10
MDRLSPFIFGCFTEEERLLYFSDEAVRSSGIEFPEDFHTSTFALSDSKPDYIQNELHIESSVENVNINNVGVNSENELRQNMQFSSEKETPREFLASSKTNMDEAIGLDNKVGSHNVPQVSGKANQIPTAKAQILCSQGENTVDKSPSNENSVANNVENAPNNVVTVGTKTMLTTSTRTVESCHERVLKSSWADLFKTKSCSKPQGPLPQLKPQEPQQPDDSLKANSMSKKDQLLQYFLDVLKKIALTQKVPSLQPRGLKNNGNWCYINSTLQVLLYCPSFYHFLMNFKLTTERGTSLTPILDGLVLFASHYNEMSPQQSAGKSRDWNRQEIVMGIPFEPKNVYKLLTQVRTTLSQQGKQEDAEEFLSCILNGLHEEMVQLTSHGDTTEEDDVVVEQIMGEWEQVGPRNKSMVTRKAAMSKSPVASMFGGYLRSSLVQPGVKESASIQPFFTIPLDLRGHVSTVQEAFDNFFQVEEVEGFQCDKSKIEVEVSKKWTLDTLPVVLVLHLKRFVVNKNSCEKLTKKISYEPQLQVPVETLSKVNKVRNQNMLTYKLFAVTYHHGKNLHGGHYTSDISHPSLGWLRADDMNVKLVPPKFVFNPLSNRDPYLLYYCRGDISN